MTKMTKYRLHSTYKSAQALWLEKLPSHWEQKRGKILFERMQRQPNDTDEIVTAFRDGQVTLRRNRREDGFTIALKEHGYQGVREDDLVIHAMDAFAGAVGVSDSNGKCSPVYSCCRPRETTNSKYYAYLTRTMALTGFIESLAKGIRERSTDFRWADFGNLYLPQPPLPEQKQIAAFLDHHTAKIDSLIAKQERLIELLEEKRQAVISHAVTKGLNPDALMKDSGVEWLGEMPAHWGVVRLKFLAREKLAGPYGSSLTKAMYTSEGYRVYGQQQVIPNNFEIGDYYIPVEKFQEMSRYAVKPGDILISVMGTIGQAALVPEDVEPGIINPRLVKYHPSNLIFGEYLQAFINSSPAQTQMTLDAKGSTMDGLSMGVLDNLLVSLPPENEQQQIIRYIAKGTANLQRTVSRVNLANDRLREHRTALISAAVTGKIDVRDWKPDESAAIEDALLKSAEEEASYG